MISSKINLHSLDFLKIMIDWFKNIINNYPEFWRNYLSTFDNSTKKIIVINLDSTGDEAYNAIIQSVGGVAIIENNIVVSDSFEINFSENIDSEIEKLIGHIGNSILIGYHINESIEILNAHLEKLQCGRLKNEAFDIEIMHQKLMLSNEKSYALDDILKFYKVPKSDRYFSSDQAFTLAMLFLKLKARLKL